MRLAVLFLCAAAAWGAAFESFAHYKVGYGFFTLGESMAVLKIESDGTYLTEVEAKATGTAAFLTGNRVETYRSRGKVVDGFLVPERFETEYRAGSKRRARIYEIDHVQKAVTETRRDCKDDRCTEKTKALAPERYAAEDILTLYHNITRELKQAQTGETTAAAVGSKEAVRVLRPQGDRLKTARKTFDNKPGFYLVVVLNQEIFTSREGELYINIDSDRVATKAVLKKTLLFGDVWGELVGKKTKGTFDAGSY